MSSIRALVVDDDPGVRTLVEDILVEDGWDTSGVPDGTEALRFLQRESPDIVFLDLMLPGMGGFEALRRIRQLCSVPVVALSALNSLEDREMFLDLGGDDYITKPFTSGELRFRARTALRRSSEHGQNIRRGPGRFSGQVAFADGYLAIDFEARQADKLLVLEAVV